MSPIVGMRFKAWDGYIYVCDSHDLNGLWMTREGCPPEHKNDTEGQWRRNVSERVVGRTFHPLYGDSHEFPPQTALKAPR